MTRPAAFPILPMLAVVLTVTPICLQAQTMAPLIVPDTAIGSSYNVPLTVTGGACATYNWSLLNGVLPPGFNLSPATGAATAISGTAGMPAQDQYIFYVTAAPTCPAASNVVQGYTIRVLAVKSSFLPPGLIGQPYSTSFAAWGINPASSAVWSATGLPPGLSMTTTGQVVGNPTTPGVFPGNVTIKADGGTRVASRAISITIAATLAFVTPPNLTATVGVPVTIPIQTSGGLPPVTIGAETNPTILGLNFNQVTGAISGTPTAAGTYQVDLIAYDAGSQQIFRTFYVNISQQPGVIVTDSLPGGTIGVPYAVTLASSGFLTAPTWSATGLPPGLYLNPAKGDITGTPTTNGTFGVTLSASTNTQTAQPKTLLIVIAPPALDFTPGVLTAGVLRAPYTASFTPTGGDGNYAFAVVGNGLPPGLSLSASGVVSGTPAQAGDFKFAVRLTSGQATVEKAVTMTVDAAPMDLTPSTLSVAYTGEPYSQTFVASGGTAAYVFQFGQSSSVPPGLQLSTAGVLAGTPTAAGGFRFSILVTDARQRRLQRDYSLTVMPSGSISTATLPDGTQGEAYRAVIESQGGAAPITFDIASGALPGGLVLSATGQITGTPTAPGQFQFTVRFTDANQRTATRALSIAVFAALVLTPDSVPNAGLLKDYSAQLTASGGQPAYVWQISNGVLPDGIFFTGGVFRGAATHAGTFGFDVTVADQRQRTVTKRYSIIVGDGPTIQIDGAVPDGVVGVSYAARFTPKGGRAPFRWSVTGQLPPGLSLGAADGSITGVPATTGTYSFTLRLEDADGLAASSAYQIKVVLGTVPTGTISGISGTSGPNNQLTFGVTTSAPFPTALDGALALTFQPDSGADDPAVLFSNGSRLMPFKVPAGSTTANFPVGRAALQTGTVAGLITMTGSLSVNGVDVTPKPAPVSTLRINPAPPVITRMDAVRTSTGFEVTIYGFTTARQITQALVTLTPTTGFALAGTQFTLDLNATFTTYFGSAASAPFGSQFKLVLPFTLGDPLAVSTVTVTLVNALGSSAPSGATL